MPRPVATPEQSLQRAVADYLAWCVPAPPDGPWWTAVNPVPAKSRAAAGISKAMGLKAGPPDIVLCWRGRLVGIELKVDGGRLSQAQFETHEVITLAGGVVTTCRSLDAVAAFLATLGVPCRAGAPYSAISGREVACHQKRLHRAARAAGRAAKRSRRRVPGSTWLT